MNRNPFSDPRPSEQGLIFYLLQQLTDDALLFFLSFCLSLGVIVQILINFLKCVPPPRWIKVCRGKKAGLSVGSHAYF